MLLAKQKSRKGKWCANAEHSEIEFFRLQPLFGMCFNDISSGVWGGVFIFWSQLTWQKVRQCSKKKKGMMVETYIHTTFKQ